MQRLRPVVVSRCAAAVATIVGSSGMTSSTDLIATTARPFSTHGRMSNEYSYGNKLADIPVLTGKEKPLTRDGEWTCSFALTERMEHVVPKILRRNNWSETEIQREISQLFDTQDVGPAPWRTVEDFQKTPWYRRFRPCSQAAAVMVSYECMKLLEAELVPPSLRKDPYSALRKRHMEDQFMNDRTSEVHAKSIRRDDLARQTKGMAQYGGVTRKSYLAFDRKFKEAQGGRMNDIGDSYNAWLQSVSKHANHREQN